MTRHWHVFEAVVFSKKIAYVICFDCPEHNEGCLAEINTVVYYYTTFTVCIIGETGDNCYNFQLKSLFCEKYVRCIISVSGNIKKKNSC